MRQWQELPESEGENIDRTGEGEMWSYGPGGKREVRWRGSFRR